MSKEAETLAQEFGGSWHDHPTFGAEDWRIEVSNHDTRLSYWDWVLQQTSIQDE